MTQRNDEQDDPFGPFNLSHFRKWMHNQNESKSRNNIVGLQVESKIPYKKLISRIETDDDIVEVAKHFKKHGGIINEVDGHHLKITTDKGTFTIHRMYIKKED